MAIQDSLGLRITQVATFQILANSAFQAPDNGFPMPLKLRNLHYLGVINYNLLTNSSGHCRIEIFNIPPFSYR